MNPLKVLTPSPKRPSDFYLFAIHLIFAIIIADSFFVATKLVIPINTIFTDFTHTLGATALFFVYFIIITGWVGYTRSIVAKPHKDTPKGTIRFTLDLIILFEFFYLLHLIVITEDGEIILHDFIFQFHWVLVAIFLTFVCWDIVKYLEYPQKKHKKETRNRGGRTLVFFIGFLILAVVYQFLINDNDQTVFSSIESKTFVFIIIAAIMNMVYRIWKLKRVDVRQPTRRKNSNSNVNS